MFELKIDQKIKKEVVLKEKYDVTIIGGGPGAVNAAIYGARNGLSVLLVSKDKGGQLLNTNVIDNYLGFYNISGEDLSNNFYKHLENFDVDILLKHAVVSITKNKEIFNLSLTGGKKVLSKSIILATGGNPRKLGVKGELELTGKGVSYCVICDGAFYIDKDVLVVGGGNSALEAALDLSKYAKNVHIVQIMDRFTGDKMLINKIRETKNITYQLESEVVEIKGNESVESVIVKKDNKLNELNTNGIFIEIGIIPSSDLVKDLVELNSFKEVITNINQETSLEGLYAIGDVTNFPYKQVITAASQGAVAALNINKYINK